MTSLRHLVVLTALGLADCGHRAEPQRAPQTQGPAGGQAGRVTNPRPDTQPYLAPARAVVRGLTIGMYDTTARQLVGAPDSMSAPEHDQLSDDTLRVWHYRDLEVEFTGRTISGVRCRRASCATPDSVRLGANRAAV